MARFQDKICVVTGAGQGIGQAVAQAFAAEGALAVIAESDPGAGREAEAAILARGQRARYLPCDVAREEDVRTLARVLAADHGAVHALVNNAGVAGFGDMFARPTSDWDRVLAVNLRGAFLCARELAPLMPPGGAIANIASTRAYMSEPGSEAYAASKGGLLSLTHALALSLAERRIRVNSVSPGWIDVSAWKKSGVAKQEELRDIDHAQHPAGRVGRPEDVAAACLYLCGPEAGFVTGADLVVDGGMTIKMIYQ